MLNATHANVNRLFELMFSPIPWWSPGYHQENIFHHILTCLVVPSTRLAQKSWSWCWRLRKMHMTLLLSWYQMCGWINPKYLTSSGFYLRVRICTSSLLGSCWFFISTYLGYSQSVTPLAFVFIGNFQSAPFQNTGQGAKAYRGKP